MRIPGAMKGKITIHDDFDDLPADIAEAFGMEPSSDRAIPECDHAAQCEPAWYGAEVVVARAHHRFTFDDYLRVEEDSVIRHEFLDGRIWAMAGGTPTHARVCANVITLLNVALAARRCSVYTTDLRIRVRATGLATYPDVSVICGHVDLDPDDPRRHTALNPALLVEVLSPSTEDYDRGEKLEHYKQIESLQEVMLVCHDQRKVIVWTRTGARWDATEHVDGVVPLAIGCELGVAAVYRDPMA
jgi:Uma2 family endonuclease